MPTRPRRRSALRSSALRLVFFGSPPAAIPSLRALLDSRHTVAAVVTAPDRPRGRGMQVDPTPVGQAALGAGVRLLRPSTLRDASVQESLSGLGADLFVVVAYGLILPRAALATPRLSCLNLHFSLLPLLRGAAPVPRALMERHATTGVTAMIMDEGMDTGPILAQIEEPISDHDTGGSLEARLASRGASLLANVVDLMAEGGARPRVQDHSLATYAPKLSPEEDRIGWAESAEAIDAKVRALDPRPGAWTLLGERRLKIWRVGVSGERGEGPPGQLKVGPGGALSVATGTSRVFLEEVQPEGRRRMSGAEFVRGYRPESGAAFS
ncbi:MAG: methionyl-tRNA formyltransferase [Actinomycetota bacterium]